MRTLVRVATVNRELVDEKTDREHLILESMHPYRLSPLTRRGAIRIRNSPLRLLFSAV